MNIEKHIQNMLKVRKSRISPKVGKLLIAEPFMRDLYFRRSVILLIDYSEEGAFGVVLNKPTFIKISEVVQEYNDINYPLFSGGPVSINNVYFLHRLNEYISDSIFVENDIFWGGNKEEILQLLKNNFFDESKLRIFMGYSSWEAGQLDLELNQNSWIVTDFDSEKLFNTPADKLWETVVDSLGEDFKLWKNLPVNPLLN